MYRLRKVFCCLLMVALLTSCATTHTVRRVDQSEGANQKLDRRKTVQYSLPRTVITVEVPIKKTIFKPGRYARFAGKYLGKPAEASPKVTHALLAEPSAAIATRSEIDSSQVFSVRLKGGPLQTRLLLLELSELGLLNHSRAEVTDKTLDFLVATIQVAADMAAKKAETGAPKVAADKARVLLSAADLSESIDPDQALALRNDFDKLTRLELSKRKIKEREEAEYSLLEEVLASTPATQRMADAVDALGKVKIKECDKSRAILGRTTIEKLLKASADVDDGKKAAMAMEILTEGKDRVLLLDPEKDLTQAKINERILKAFGSMDPSDAIGDDGSLKRDAVAEDPALKDLEVDIQPLLITDADTVLIKIGDKKYKYVNSSLSVRLIDFFEEIVAIRVAYDLDKARAEKKKLLSSTMHSRGTSSGLGAELLLKAIDAKVARLEEQFFGKKTEVKWTARFEVDPGESVPCSAHGYVDTVLFELSETEGLLVNESQQIKLTNPQQGLFVTHRFLTDTPVPKVCLRLWLDLDNQLGHFMRTKAPQQKERRRTGLRYRVPVVVESALVVSDPGAMLRDGPRKGESITPTPVLASASVPIPQWGVVRYLPRRTGSWRQSTLDLTLFGNTGAIQKVEVTNEALDPALVTDLGAAAGTVQAAVIAAEQAKAEAKAQKQKEWQTRLDPVTYLERSKEVLTLMDDINGLLNPVPAESEE